MKRITGKVTRLTSLFLLLLIIAVNTSYSQSRIDCAIKMDGTQMPVCPDIYFELFVFEQANQKYDWQIKNGNVFISVGDEPEYGSSIEDSTTFRVIVIDTIQEDTCVSDLFGVSVRPQIVIDFIQIDTTCTGGSDQVVDNAKVQAIASGAFESDEYQYIWDVPPINIDILDSSIAWGLRAHQYYNITVVDEYACPKTESFWIEAYDNPLIEIDADPDTAYIQNPFITYSYINLSEDSIPIQDGSPSWWFSDTIYDPENISNEEEPTYMYGSVGEYWVELKVRSDRNCDTVFSKTVFVKPVELFIPNVFTPGTGDDVNETFEITDDPDKLVRENPLIKFYVSSRLTVFNRSGRVVFRADNYDNSWNGDNLPDGVYYYVLECYGVKSNDVFKGSVTIIRGN
jgi:CHU domain-containing protein